MMPSSPPAPRGRLAVLYHFMHPDDVISAHLLDGFAQDLAAQGWEVEALPCNRGCHDPAKTYGAAETHRGVRYRRVWRPALAQKSFKGRLLNALWMIAAWTRLALRPRRRRPDVVVVGTDPVFAALVALPLRLLAPRMRLVHWCFDLHPEASAVTPEGRPPAALLTAARWAMGHAYRRFDLIADLGRCMRQRLRAYGHRAAEAELTPWALVEPAAPVARDPGTRAELFGAEAKLGILYSGSFGEAHDHDGFLALARSLRGHPEIQFCFAIRGNRAEAVRAAVSAEDTNVSFAGFASVEELERRLGSADVHLVSLKAAWAGVAVPSKFFGSLAAGRPVLYAGPRDSAIGDWIEAHGIGWRLEAGTMAEIAERLIALSRNPAELDALKEHCHAVYGAHFARATVMMRWDQALCALTQGVGGSR